MREYLLSKLINAENLAKTFAHNFKFAECCTRKNLLEDLVKDFGIGEKLVKPVSKLNMLAATTKKAFGLKIPGTKDKDKKKEDKNEDKKEEKDAETSLRDIYNQDRYTNSYQLTKTDSKGGLAWPVYLKKPKPNSNSTVKVPALLAISWCRLMLVVSDNMSDRVIFSIPTKSILGWQAYGKQCRLFYGNCECIQFFITTGATAGYQALALSKDPAKDITYRLSNCTPGHDCLTLNPKPQTSLKSGKQNPIHNFEIDDKFRVVSVETKSNAYHIGLRPGHLIVEANKTLASEFDSYRDLKRIIETGQNLSILVVPAPPEYRKKGANHENLHSETIYHRIPKLSYGIPSKNATQVDPPPLSTDQLPSVSPDAIDDEDPVNLFGTQKYIDQDNNKKHRKASRKNTSDLDQTIYDTPIETRKNKNKARKSSKHEDYESLPFKQPLTKTKAVDAEVDSILIDNSPIYEDPRLTSGNNNLKPSDIQNYGVGREICRSRTNSGSNFSKTAQVSLKNSFLRSIARTIETL